MNVSKFSLLQFYLYSAFNNGNVTKQCYRNTLRETRLQKEHTLIWLILDSVIVYYNCVMYEQTYNCVAKIHFTFKKVKSVLLIFSTVK